jgi:hypothetical protein
MLLKLFSFRPFVLESPIGKKTFGALRGFLFMKNDLPVISTVLNSCRGQKFTSAFVVEFQVLPTLLRSELSSICSIVSVAVVGKVLG